MSSFEEHCNQCEILLGERHEKVHRFLDQFFQRFGLAHRMVLHHTYGVLIIRRMFGPDAEKAAIIHIRADLGRVPTPEDWCTAEDLIRMADCTYVEGDKTL